MRIAVLFDSFGPYHIARLVAASRKCEILGVEVARRSRDYPWVPTNGAIGFRREVLVEHGTSDEADRRVLSARLDEVLSSFNPSVFAIPGWSNPTSCMALRWCIRRGVPAVLMSESQLIDEPRQPLKEWIKRQSLRAFAAALVGGRSHREYAIQLGMSADEIFLGYDAIENEHFARHSAAARENADEVRRELRLPSAFFLASSRFIPKKNLPFLLRCFARYRQECAGTPWDLVLLGDGPLRAEIESLVASLGLTSSICLPGFKQYGELPAYYGLAGAFVHVSTTEQWGLVVNEAMASGLPVVVSNRCGCAAELVGHCENGFQIDPSDETALSQFMEKIAGDAELRTAMGHASSNRIREWGPDRFASGLQAAATFAWRAGPRRRRYLNSLILRFLSSRRSTG
jgi:glycosyltransferase involved in cell wall biosynthesis